MSSTRRSQSRAAYLLNRIAVLGLLAVLPAAGWAQSTTPAVSTLVAFSGSQSYASPVRGPDGALYGTTATINFVTGGLIYRFDRTSTRIETIHQLRVEDGYSPFGGLTLASDGLLYGTTSLGAANVANSTGTIYRLNTDGTGFVVLHRFQSFTTSNTIGAPINADGANPEAELIEGSDGHLYGVARTGGEHGNGTVFKVARDGSAFAVLHTFGATTSEATVVPPTNVDGIGPLGPLVEAADGYFYGTTSRGGTTGYGTIFRVRFDGTGFEVVRTFPVLTASGGSTPAVNLDGGTPLAGLTDGEDGRLYGVASLGGSNGYGTVYALDPVSGVFSVLHDFDGTRGSQPSGELLLAQDGRLYGTTATGGTSPNGSASLFGTIFSISRDGTGFASIFSFDGSNGSSPTGRLLQIDATTFVGVAQAGGRCGQGTLYQLSLTGAEARGVTNCGRKKNSGSGSMAPALLLLLAAAGLARRVTAG